MENTNLTQELLNLSQNVDLAQEGKLPLETQTINTEELLLKLRSYLIDREHKQATDILEKSFFESAYKAIFSMHPVSVEEQLLQCTVYGVVFREQHKQIKTYANGLSTARYVPIEPKSIAALLPLLVNFKRIGERDDSSSKLYAYHIDEGIYVADSRFIDIFISSLQDGVTDRNATEIRRWIDQRTEFTKINQDPNMVIMKNGVFNVQTKELMPYSPDNIFINKINVNYNPNARHPHFPQNWTWNKFLSDQFKSKDDIKMAWQLIQYTLLTNMPKNVFVYLYDVVGNTGKSMFANVIKNMVGPFNTGTANLNDFEEKFAAASIYDKVFIYGDENDSQYIKLNHLMKSMATGDPIKVEYKGEQAFTVRVTPMIVQAMNSTPIFKHMDGGTKRRMRVIEFGHSYSGNVNLDVKNKYIYNEDLLEWIAYTALSAKVEDFVDSENSIAVKGEIELESNPVKAYIDDRLSVFSGTSLPTWLVFADFQVWLKEQNKISNWSQTGFIRALRTELYATDWELSDTKSRGTKTQKADYDIFYEAYLRSGAGQKIGVFLPYNTDTQLKTKTSRTIFKTNITTE